MEFGLDTVIVAVIGALATIYGIREARAGRRDATVQQAAANRLSEEKQELETLRLTIDNERAEADRAMAARNEARTEAEAERKRRVEIENDLMGDVRREKTARVEAETAVRMAEEHLRRVMSKHSAEMQELLLLVREQVALEAGRTEHAIEVAERGE